MFVLLFAHAVELQINTMLPGGLRRFAELNIFSKTNSVGCGQDAIETNLPGVSDGFQVVRRERGLATREQDNDLSFRFERNSAIKNRFCIFERRLVNVTNLVRIHEAWVAHHVAAVGKIDSEYCAAAKLNVRSSMLVHMRVFGGLKIATKEKRLDALEKRRIRSHHVYELAVFRASLAHDDLAVLFDNLCFDFAGMLVHQRFERSRAVDHGCANFLHAARAKRICLARKTERRRGSFVRLQKRTGCPIRANSFAFRQTFVNGLKSLPGNIRQGRNHFRAGYSAQFWFVCLAAAELVAKQLKVLLNRSDAVRRAGNTKSLET